MTVRPKDIYRESLPKDYQTIYVNHSVLSKEQEEKIISTFFEICVEEAEDKNSILHHYLDEIRSSSYILNYVLDPRTGLNLSTPLSYIRMSSKIMYHLAFGNNPDGTPRTRKVLKRTLPTYVEPAPLISFEEYKNKRINESEKRKLKKSSTSKTSTGKMNWAAESSSEDDEEDDDELEKKYKQEYEKLGNERDKKINEMVDVSDDPIVYRLCDICVSVTPEQGQILKDKRIEEAVIMNKPESVIQEFKDSEVTEGGIFIRTCFVKDPGAEYEKSILQGKIFGASHKWITEEFVKSQFEVYSTDKNVHKNKNGSKFTYPLVNVKSNADSQTITITFSPKISSSSDAGFCKYMKEKTTFVNPKNQDQKVLITFRFKKVKEETDRKPSDHRTNQHVEYKKKPYANKGSYDSSNVDNTEDAFIGNHLIWKRSSDPQQKTTFDRKPLSLLPPSKVQERLPEITSSLPPTKWSKKNLPPIAPLDKSKFLNEPSSPRKEIVKEPEAKETPKKMYNINLLTYSFSGRPRITYMDLEKAEVKEVQEPEVKLEIELPEEEDFKPQKKS